MTPWNGPFKLDVEKIKFHIRMLFQDKPLASSVVTKVELQTGNRVSVSELRSRVFISLNPYMSPVVGCVERAHEWDVKLRGMLEQCESTVSPNERWKQFSRDQFVSTRLPLNPHAFRHIYI